MVAILCLFVKIQTVNSPANANVLDVGNNEKFALFKCPYVSVIAIKNKDLGKWQEAPSGQYLELPLLGKVTEGP